MTWLTAAPAGVILWGLIATAVMTTLLEFSQRLGVSRLSLPFLFGTFVTGDRHRAYVFGFLLYLLGGWLFAGLYFWIFLWIGQAGCWLGAVVGAAHGAFLVCVMLPLMPHLHPRMATQYDGPTASRRLEPPGFLGLNYGYGTPAITVAGQVVYGILLGCFLPLG